MVLQVSHKSGISISPLQGEERLDVNAPQNQKKESDQKTTGSGISATPHFTILEENTQLTEQETLHKLLSTQILMFLAQIFGLSFTSLPSAPLSEEQLALIQESVASFMKPSLELEQLLQKIAELKALLESRKDSLEQNISKKFSEEELLLATKQMLRA